MAKVQINWNRNALYEIRSSAQGLVDSHLERMCAEANSMTSGTFEWESHQGARAPQGRWRGTIYPVDGKARAANARDNILIRVLGG